MSGCGDDCNKCIQPFGAEVFVADNVFVKQMVIPQAGTYVPQHSHKYDHLSMLAVGSVKVWENGEYKGEVSAPTGIFIKAGVKHLFQALQDNTIIYCVHSAARPDYAAVVEEHQL